MSKMRFKLEPDAPAVVSQAPPEIKDWGPWQLPAIERMSDGGLHIGFQIGADSATEFGKPNGHAVSYDGGSTWEDRPEFPGGEGGSVLLANGDRLKVTNGPSPDIDGIPLPEPIFTREIRYTGRQNYYNASDIPAEYNGWYLLRQKNGETRWKVEKARVNIPGEVRQVIQNVLILPFFTRIRLTPDGSLWGLTYEARMDGGPFNPGTRVILTRSADDGYTWDFVHDFSFIADKMPFECLDDTLYGYSEPDVLFLKDGGVLCLLRTHENLEPSPMYKSFSSDNGKTWSEPEIFDGYGVWPVFLNMGKYSLLAYGRPGLCLRISDDGAGEEWSDKIEIVEMEINTDFFNGGNTCAYADLLKFDDHTAMICYSHFKYPDENGVPRKSILAQKIHITYCPEGS
jgi:hypothetical protein